MPCSVSHRRCYINVTFANSVALLQAEDKGAVHAGFIGGFIIPCRIGVGRIYLLQMDAERSSLCDSPSKHEADLGRNRERNQTRTQVRAGYLAGQISVTIFLIITWHYWIASVEYQHPAYGCRSTGFRYMRIMQFASSTSTDVQQAQTNLYQRLNSYYKWGALR